MKIKLCCVLLLGVMSCFAVESAQENENLKTMRCSNLVFLHLRGPHCEWRTPNLVNLMTKSTTTSGHSQKDKLSGERFPGAQNNSLFHHTNFCFDTLSFSTPKLNHTSLLSHQALVDSASEILAFRTPLPPFAFAVSTTSDRFTSRIGPTQDWVCLL